MLKTKCPVRSAFFTRKKEFLAVCSVTPFDPPWELAPDTLISAGRGQGEGESQMWAAKALLVKFGSQKSNLGLKKGIRYSRLVSLGFALVTPRQSSDNPQTTLAAHWEHTHSWA